MKLHAVEALSSTAGLREPAIAFEAASVVSALESNGKLHASTCDAKDSKVSLAPDGESTSEKKTGGVELPWHWVF